MTKKRVQWPDPFEIHTLVFDFDGVFTDNFVYIDEKGREYVRCSRGDGFGIKMLFNWVTRYHPSLVVFILSTEKNPVVKARALKLNIHCHQDIRDKKAFLDKHLESRARDYHGLVYLGNDLNDLEVIRTACFSVVPLDAHPLLKKHASVVLKEKGGNQFVRSFIEKFLKVASLPEAKLRELII